MKAIECMMWNTVTSTRRKTVMSQSHGRRKSYLNIQKNQKVRNISVYHHMSQPIVDFFLASLEEIGKLWKWWTIYSYFHTAPCSKLTPLPQGGHRKVITQNVRNF